MASEADVQAAETARLEEIIAVHGSEAERNELALDLALSRIGMSAWQGAGLRERVERLARRAERRARLSLPAVECGGDPPTHGCRCLERALDECDGGKRAVLRAARRLHWAPPPRVERRLGQEEKPAAVPASHSPNGDSEQVTHGSPRPPAKPEPPFRIVHRTRKWFDPPEGPSRFSETKF